MNQNIIHNGMIVTADTSQAEGALQRLGSRQSDLLNNSRVFAREYPRNLDRAFAPIKNINDRLQTTHTQIERLTWESRKLAQQLNSVVMTGVALSMTGVSFMEVGRTIVGGFTQMIQKATEFEKTMKEVEFLGGLKDAPKELQKIQDKIMEIGVSLPTTNQKVAEGMVEAMKAGFSTKEALNLAPIMSEMAFTSMGKMTEADSLKMMNTWLKTTSRNTDDARMSFDKFAKTADLFTTDIDGINRAFQSTRAAFDTMQLGKQAMGEESFLAMIGMMSTQHNPRASGMMMNSFSRGLAQAVGSSASSKRGQLWDALGINYESEDDILATMDKISKRSKEIWGDTKARQEKLIDLFGVEGLPVLQMMEKYEKSGKNIFQLRDAIKDSAGYSKEYMDAIMGTSYGTQMILKGTWETLQTLIGLTVLGPVNKILWGISKALGAITMFAQKHPQITKFISLFVLFGGVAAMATGAILLFGGALLAMYGSLASTVVMLGQMNATQEMLDNGFNSLGKIFNMSFVSPLKRGLLTMAKFSIAGGLMYLAWKHDIMGMRTITENFFSSLDKAKDLSSKLMFETPESYMKTMTNLQNENPMLAWLTETYTKGKLLWGLVKGLWDDGKITAKEVGGEENLRNMYNLAEKLGVLPIVDTIMDWKGNIEAFWEGFWDGARRAGEIVKPVLTFIGDLLVWIYDKITWVAEKFGVMGSDSDKFRSSFEKIGIVVGMIAGFALSAWIAFKAWRLTLGPIVGLIANIFGGLARIVGLVKGGGLMDKLFPKDKIADNIKKGIKGGLSGATRLFAKALLLDKMFPSIFGRDGGVKSKGATGRMSYRNQPDIRPQNTRFYNTMSNQNANGRTRVNGASVVRLGSPTNLGNANDRRPGFIQGLHSSARGRTTGSPRFVKSSVNGGQTILRPTTQRPDKAPRSQFGSLQYGGRGFDKTFYNPALRTGGKLEKGMERLNQWGQSMKFGSDNMHKGVNVRTLKSDTMRGRARDLLLGRRLDVSRNGNRTSYRGINEHGQTVSRNIKSSDVRFNKRGEVRTNKGLLQAPILLGRAAKDLSIASKNGVVAGATGAWNSKVGRTMRTDAKLATLLTANQFKKFGQAMGKEVAAKFHPAATAMKYHTRTMRTDMKIISGMAKQQAGRVGGAVMTGARAVGNKVKGTRAYQGMSNAVWGARNRMGVIGGMIGAEGRDLAHRVRNKSAVAKVQSSRLGMDGRNRTMQVHRKGGLMGGMSDWMMGSQVYDKQGNYVGRQNRRGGGVKKATRAGRAMNMISGAMFGNEVRGNRGGMKRGGDMLKGLFGNIGDIAKHGGKVGKGLLKGIMFGLKAPLRAIPILGQLLMMWDIISLAWSNWDAIKNAATVAWNWIKTTGVAKLKEAWTNFVTMVPIVIEGIKAGFTTAFEWVKANGLTKLGEFFNWLIFTALPWAANALWTGIKWAWSNIVVDGIVMLGQVWNWLLFTAVPWAAQGVWNGIKAAWNWIKTDGLAMFLELWGKFLTWATEKAIAVKDAVLGYMNTLKEQAVTALSNFFQPLQDAWDATKSYISEHPITQTIKKVTEFVTGGNGADGSHRTGLDNVGRDGYLAQLHGGEMVLTRSEAQVLRAMRGSNSTMDFLKKRAVDGSFRVGTDEIGGKRKLGTGFKPKKQTASPTDSEARDIKVGDTVIKFEKGAVQINVDKADSESEIEKMAEKMFRKFKQKVELDNMRNYKPARGAR